MVHNVNDLGPQHKLVESLDEKDKRQVEWEVERSPDLLAPWGQMIMLHPVEVNEEDAVDRTTGGSNNPDR